MRAILAAAVLALSGCATTAHRTWARIPEGARYVAMGSSYAAGALIGPLAAGSPKRCGRTENNYPHLLAKEMGLDLADVSCGGATTAHILGPWSELAPQIDAVSADTRLVTVTIGGNDLGYVRNLMLSTCEGMPGRKIACPAFTWPTDADYQVLEQHLRQIAREVRRRAPQATLIFVDYLRVLPDSGSCPAIPLDERQTSTARGTFRRMADVTKAVAAAEGAMLLPAGRLSKGHDACSTSPWAAGHPGKPADWHPTAEGHAAIAKALAARLR